MPHSSRRRELRVARRALERQNPQLKSDGYRISSPKSDCYNCIAFAADVSTKNWWPIRGLKGYDWPDDVPVERTLDAFIRAFETLDYKICQSSELEKGIEKVAIYAMTDILGRKLPTHMAWQSPSGKWKSKIGWEEDITHHSLSGLEGGQYGWVAVVLKRKRKPRTLK